MSCVSFGGAGWLDRLRAAAADPRPVSTFRSPEVTEAKVRRVRLLATSDDARVRESAALSYAAPPDVLAALADDVDRGVRCSVARNPHASAEVLRRLGVDPDAAVRGWVAANPNAVGLLDDLAADSDGTVRSVARWAAQWPVGEG